MSTNVKKWLDASLKIKAGSAELIAGTAFHLPPVLCYQWRVNCWEMIPASGEIQQDVDRNDADMANTWTWKYWPYNHICTVTRCFSAKVCFTHDELPLIDCQVWTGLLDTDGDTSLWYWFNITGLLYVKTGRGHNHKSKPRKWTRPQRHNYGGPENYPEKGIGNRINWQRRLTRNRRW